ncbi:hypothetical protein OGATHE_000444 [Ogataea polymorpha]|uniref:Major facilitator superfamily (MFS) profile domain-containing protein n=1 Tax=Ogataea polymorpha TaxID=460523 RepID=A0A9P8PUF0_9ASCO|nr:hypothetical protein OGATHE_000444 [Ogataea polymorpha]
MSIRDSVTMFMKTARHVEHQKSELVLLIVLVGCAFDLVNVTATISSMSEIQRHFDTTYSKASWVLSAYAVAFSGFIAVSGRIGDIIGHANLYIWSSVLFALFSLLCGAVDSLTALIVFRTLQGVAAAALVPSGYAIVARSFPPEKLGSRFSILAAGFSLSFGVGYIVGGAFDLTSVGYKGIYYVSGGVMFVDAALGFFFIKDIPPTGEKVVNLDAVGSFLLIGATTLVVVGFTEAGEVWNSPKTYLPLLMGGIFYVVFYFWNTEILARVQQSGRHFKQTVPLMPRSLLTTLVPVCVLVAVFMNYCTLFAIISLSAEYFQYVEQNSPILAAVKLAPNLIGMFVVTTLLSLKNDILSPYTSFMLGYSGIVAAAALCATWNSNHSHFYWRWIVPMQGLSSAGSSFFFPHSLNVLIGAADPDVRGLVSGVMQTFGQVGVSLCFAVVTSVLGNGAKTDEKFRICGYVLIAVASVGWLCCLAVYIRGHKTREKTPDA